MNSMIEILATLGLTKKVFIIHAIMIALGAMARAFHEMRTEKKFTWLGFITAFITSTFSGVIFVLVAITVLGQENMTAIAYIAGMGGWLGVEGLTMVTERLKKIFQAEKEQ